MLARQTASVMFRCCSSTSSLIVGFRVSAGKRLFSGTTARPDSLNSDSSAHLNSASASAGNLNASASHSAEDSRLQNIVIQQYAAFAALSSDANAKQAPVTDAASSVRASSPQWERVCGKGQLTEGKRCVLRVDKRWIAVFRYQGAFFAIDDVCAHVGFSLGRGRLLPDGRIECPGHGWKFNIRTGASDYPEIFQRTFPVEEREDGLFVDVNTVLNADKFVRKPKSEATVTPL